MPIDAHAGLVLMRFLEVETLADSILQNKSSDIRTQGTNWNAGRHLQLATGGRNCH